jgi:DNA-binding GntR family transcriptional regulator
MTSLASPLQARILSQLQTRFGHDATVGERINEAEIAAWLGVSRTPVREVLLKLEREGILTYERQRGFRLARLPALPGEAARAEGGELLDEKVMRDMALGTLAAAISERALMQRYGVPRGVLVSTLRRLMRDQLVEPAPGRGWRFADVGPTALRESYRFRQILEPATILADGFAPDRAALAALDAEHAAAMERLEETGWRRLFELDADFHALVARGAGTRYLVDAIARQNNIRRVNEYFAFVRLGRVRGSMAEHRGIIAALLAGRYQHAAALMRVHLDVSQQETFDYLDADLERLQRERAAGGAR